MIPQDRSPEIRPLSSLVGLRPLVLMMAWLAAGPLAAQSNTTGPAPSPPAVNSQQRLLDLPPGEGPLQVQASFHLLALHLIDDEQESFKFSGVLTLVWMDSRQAFDPDEEGVAEKLYNGAYQFNELAPAWYPQVVLANAIDLADSQGVLLSVKPDGTSTLVQTITAEARTRLDLRRYPFDRQNLEAVFGVLGFNDNEVVLTTTDEPSTANLPEFQIPQWDLTEVSSATGSAISPFSGRGARCSVLTVSLDTRRQSFFMLRLVILPLILIVVLSWSVFWMDRSSLGDRMSVSFVGILTAVAYQIMVSGIMPQISYVTLMNSFLSLSFLIMSATVLINLLVGSLDKKGEEARGERLDLRCRRVFPAVYAAMLAISVIVAFVWL